MRFGVSKSGQIVVEDTATIANIFGHYPVAHRPNGTYRILPHKSSITKVLRNLGAAVEAPILSMYDWSNDKPFDSQKKTAAMLCVERRGYVLSSMGVGKTRAAIYAFDWLKREGEAKRMLVLAPLSTVSSVWENEVFAAFPHLSTEILHGTKKHRLKRLAESKADIFIINHDGVKVIGDQLVGKFDVVCVDELQKFRNAQTAGWKKLDRITSPATYVWGMTGSPTPNSPTDAHGQIRLVTPGNVTRSFRLFRMETMEQVSAFRWEPKPDAKETVHAAMQPSVRYRLEDCHDLPPQTVSARDALMSAKQVAAYREMLSTLTAEIKLGRVTAANEGAKMQKLLQIASGFVYDGGVDGDGKTAVVLGGEDRYRTILDIIEESEKKVIVFSSHRWLVNAVGKVLNAKGVPTRVVHGGTSPKERTETFTLFQNSNAVQVISAQPGTIALGLTLTAASTIVWNGPTMNPEEWVQANARIHRRGQDTHTQVICLQSSPVERRQYARLRRKQSYEGLLLEMFAQGEFNV